MNQLSECNETGGIVNMVEQKKDVNCIYCSEEQRVFTFHKLQKGDHICLAGSKLKFNAFNKQFAMYKHHALIKELIQRDTDGSSAMVTMIHFKWTPFSQLIKLRETTEKQTLYNDEIYKHIYRFPTDPDTIINKAITLLAEHKKHSYSILSNNCEHMVRGCIASTTKSLQVDELARNTILWASFIRSVIENLIPVIKKRPHLQSAIRKTLSWIVHRLTGKTKEKNAVAYTAVVTLGCMTFINLVWCIYRTHRFYKEFHQGKQICQICFLQKKWEIWLTFGAYAISNLGFGILNFSNTKLPSVWFFWGSVNVSVFLMYLAQNAFVGLKSPFRGSEVLIKEISELNNGDVMKYYYMNIPHVGIVTNINMIKSNTTKQAKITIVHYSWPSIISRRQITEEEIDIDLTKENVWQHDYSYYNVHSPNEVVRRARLRLGETKFAFFSNRSSHFCFWAKVDETAYDNEEHIDIEQQNILHQPKYERPFSNSLEQGGQSLEQGDDQSLDQGDIQRLEQGDDKSLKQGDDKRLKQRDDQLPQVYIDHQIGKLISTNRYEKRIIRIREEIKPGDVIEFRFNYNLLHKAICISTSPGQKHSEVELTFVHYGSSYKVVKETKTFDLNQDTVNIYLCHPVHRYPRDDITRRAKEKLENNEQKYSIISRRASHFVDEIISLSEISEIVPKDVLKDVLKGDAIIYRLMGSWHDAIVSDVLKNKHNDKITVTVIHYWQKHCFATREIMEKKIDVKPGLIIKKKEFKGYNIYPNMDTVGRAKSRIGEKRFNIFYNTSSDFVHWCKVVQTPSVYSIHHSSNERRHVVVIPLTGEVYEEQFHKNWIKTLGELNEGSIIKIRGQFGILMSINGNKVTLVFYNEEKVTQTEFEFDFKKEKKRIWIYWCNPSTCQTNDEIIKRVITCLDKPDEIPAVTSAWEFCKWCVLTPYAELFHKKSIKNERELIKGSILKVKGQFGILCKSEKKDSNWELVCYNQSHKDVRSFEIDLKNIEENHWIFWCTPSTYQNDDDIIQRALTCLEKNQVPAVITSAWEFCKWCVLIELSESFYITLIETEQDLCNSEGSILKVDGNFGILKSIQGSSFKLLIYNQREKSVKEMDFKFYPLITDQPIWIYHEGVSIKCHTRNNIIERASNCLDRKEKIPAVTTAWEFCKWCVLEENEESFYKTLVQTRTDLIKGSILIMQGEYGILNSIQGNKIELVFYDKNENVAVKTDFEFDLQKETIWIYRGASGTCNTRSDIIQRASTYLNRKPALAFKSSKEFCKWCVQIDHAEWFNITFNLKNLQVQIIEGSILKVQDQFGIVKSTQNNNFKLLFYNDIQKGVHEEDFELDSEETVWIYEGAQNICHPHENIVIRASNCLRKKDKIPPTVTTAWEFCKWCVLKTYVESKID